MTSVSIGGINLHKYDFFGNLLGEWSFSDGGTQEGINIVYNSPNIVIRSRARMIISYSEQFNDPRTINPDTVISSSSWRNVVEFWYKKL